MVCCVKLYTSVRCVHQMYIHLTEVGTSFFYSVKLGGDAQRGTPGVPGNASARGDLLY